MRRCTTGVAGRASGMRMNAGTVRNRIDSGTLLERAIREGDNPVHEIKAAVLVRT